MTGTRIRGTTVPDERRPKRWHRCSPSYDRVAARTDELVASLPDLDAAHPLPEAPWFEAGARWSVRRVILHVIAETAQHAGHADVIRETIDGAKSMG